MQDVIVIVGPTGVGKTKLSIELAKKLDAEIINGDSVSIYKDLDIGSAKPTKMERREVPHHLVDICPVDQYYSVYNYQKDVRSLIDELTKKKKKIIIVGGTGLYIKAALYDYNFSLEEKSNSYDNLTNEEIYTRIKAFNVGLEMPHINNRQRLVRLLNKLENKALFSSDKDKVIYPHIIIGLTTDRSYLYDRIDKRVDEMFDNGLVEEVNRLRNSYSKSRILNSAIGYKEFKSYFNKEKSLEEVKEEIKKNSRHYAKRQYTFFYNQFNTKWFNVNFNDFSKTVDEVVSYINDRTK